MASYHFRTKGYSAHTGQAIEHADYIMRRGRFADREDGVHREAINMPSWADNAPWRFWEAADTLERANGRAAREFELALPVELDTKQQIELVRQYIKEQLGCRHASEWSIHDKGDGNPHVHIMYSERTQDGIERDRQHFFKQANKKAPEQGGCLKEEGWNVGKGKECEKLLKARSLWANLQNAHLARAGALTRVDHRSLKAQGIERTPQIHVGPKNKACQHIYVERRARNEVIISGNALADQERTVASELAASQKELAEITATLQQMEARRHIPAEFLSKVETAAAEPEQTTRQEEIAARLKEELDAAKAQKRREAQAKEEPALRRLREGAAKMAEAELKPQERRQAIRELTRDYGDLAKKHGRRKAEMILRETGLAPKIVKEIQAELAAKILELVKEKGIAR